MITTQEVVIDKVEKPRCRSCGRILSSYNRGSLCWPCQASEQSNLDCGGESQSQAKLRHFAEFYGYSGDGGSLRRFAEHVRGVKGARVLGVTWDKASGYCYHCEVNEIQGPIPDIPTAYLLPPRLKGQAISLEIVPGQVSSRIYCHEIRLRRVHPDIVLSVETGQSGPICKPISKP
jgi:hypothetical protein